jgi:uncharacterized protein YegP (UPF0339 family)
VKYVVFQGQSGLFYWHRLERNGRITQDGSQGYSRKWNAQRAAKRACGDAPVRDAKVKK